MAEVAENSEDQSSQVEVLGDVVLTLLYSFIDIRYSFIEVVPVQVQNRPKVVKSRYVIIAELR